MTRMPPSPAWRQRLHLPPFRVAAASLLLGLLCACAHSPAQRNPLATWTPSQNYDKRHPYLVIIHFTAQDSLAASLDTLRTRNNGGPVSAHYLIGKDGKRYQLVADADRAWQAGRGSWGAISDVNSASIGIELENNGSEPFAKDQIDSLIVLLNDLCTRLSIPRSNVIGHQDLAPARKPDPGPLFPWNALAKAGFGLWPDSTSEAPAPGFDPWLALRAIGYSLSDRNLTVRAFHNHYRGTGGDELDAQDLRILNALTNKLKTSAIPEPVLIMP